MKKICFISLLLISVNAFAKSLNGKDTTNFDSIRNLEYQLEGLSNNIINGEDQKTRIVSTYYFIQKLKSVLVIKNSFNYNFTLIKTVSILKPDDNKFRIFTWNLLLDSGKYMYFGVIQMNQKDSVKIFGLYDSSHYIEKISYNTFDNRHWVGALYYQIHQYKYKKKTKYLLMGWDGEDAKVNRKIIEILWFDDNGNPQFGQPVFDNGGNIQSRMVFTFAEEATMLLRYEKDKNVIVLANTVPPNPYLKGKFQYYLPDGSYDFFKFEKGFWVRYMDFYKNSKNPHKYRLE
ncbi:MAG: hypothetical protein IT243_06430 [Bacteroidia bacterium]|nr:hypothetical protein [Bacteroidia bacterium]